MSAFDRWSRKLRSTTTKNGVQTILPHIAYASEFNDEERLQLVEMAGEIYRSHLLGLEVC